MQEPPFSDQEILAVFRNSNFIHPSVYDFYSDKAFVRLVDQGASQDVAEELVLQAWESFLAKLPKFEYRGEGKLLAYFKQICIRIFYTYCRNNNKGFGSNFREDLDDIPDVEDPWQIKKAKLIEHMLKFSGEKLRPVCRKLFQYRYRDNLSLAEIDRLMGAKNSDGTSSAKNQLYRCRKKLRALLIKLFKSN